MQESNKLNWADRFTDEAEAEIEAPVSDAEAEAANQADAGETDGWQQYRRWISKAPAPNRRRSGVDPSLYTWKGYRDWTEQIKRNWSDNS